MPEKKLRELVESLHKELGSTPSVDAESRKLLEQLTADIDQLTARDEAAAGRHSTVLEEIDEAAVRFESEHPRLAMLLGNIADTLAKLGI